MIRRILIWDAPTRVFHWLQAISFAGAYLTAESERNRDIHMAFGYILLGLIVFRLLWGFLGTRYARFSSFLFKLGEIIAYLLSLIKGKPGHYLGHNPAGSVSVWLLLALGLFLCVTGVMALQDDAVDAVVELHGIATSIMLAVILLHVIGVLVSSVLHRENLVRSMITGFKSAETDEGIRSSYNWLGVIMLAAAVVFWFVFLR
ncbi:MAG: cytochrome B [Gallionellales bacterium RIFCSPLOWO2_02_FULL_57_47]|nr:MAG: cytochrome B [Gallionellales bacterium RIFCSPLOWO2_02_FULL_57_47]OGT10438.1 MAG: cytochrome B [Gallionellales bacterium RIFCSPHIGHO2_02_FULL_57_16]